MVGRKARSVRSSKNPLEDNSADSRHAERGVLDAIVTHVRQRAILAAHGGRVEEPTPSVSMCTNIRTCRLLRGGMKVQLPEVPMSDPAGRSDPRPGQGGNRLGGSILLRSGRVDADDSLVAVLVGDHGERGRVAVIDDGPARGDGSGDPLPGRLGCHIDLDVEPLTRGLVFVCVSEPQVWYPSRGVPDLVAGGPAALGICAPGQ